MSTIAVTTITTANGTTNQVVSTGNSAGPSITLGAATPSMTFNSNSSTTAMFIASNGNIGVGNTAPTSSLVVNGAITLSDNTQFNSVSSFGYRNKIINGALQFWQRATSFTGLTTNSYSADRFYLNIGTPGTGVFSITRSTDVPAGQGFPYSLLFQPTTAISTLNAATFAGINHAVEGFTVSDLGYGTANAKAMVLSYWVKTSFTGTLSGGIIQRQAGTQRVLPWTYAVTSNTWTKITVPIPGDTAGTLPNSNVIVFEIDFGYMCIGTNYSAGTPTAGVWNVNTSGNQYATQSYNYASSTSNTWQITGVQLEKSSVATPFEFRAYEQEYTLCRRYYEVCYLTVIAASRGLYESHYPFKVEKRGNPTLVVVAGGVAGASLATMQYAAYGSMPQGVLGFRQNTNGSTDIDAIISADSEIS